MILRPILDPKIGTIRRLKSERLIGIAEYFSLLFTCSFDHFYFFRCRGQFVFAFATKSMDL